MHELLRPRQTQGTTESSQIERVSSDCKKKTFQDKNHKLLQQTKYNKIRFKKMSFFLKPSLLHQSKMTTQTIPLKKNIKHSKVRFWSGLFKALTCSQLILLNLTELEQVNRKTGGKCSMCKKIVQFQPEVKCAPASALIYPGELA